MIQGLSMIFVIFYWRVVAISIGMNLSIRVERRNTRADRDIEGKTFSLQIRDMSSWRNQRLNILKGSIIFSFHVFHT